MPITPGQGFFGGLAKGIFDSLEERRLLSQQREDQERKQSLSFLAGLMDQVEPESRPLLLKQIGDVMSMRTPQLSFWDRLTGGGLDRGRQAIQERTQGVLGSLIGPAQARAQRVRAVYEGAAQAAPSIPQTFAEASGLANKIVLRDPFREKLDELKAHYGLQAQASFARLEEQQRLIGERELQFREDQQRHRLEVLDYKSDIKAKADITERANQIAISQGRVKIMPSDEQEAAAQIIREQGLTESLKRALLDLRGAETKALQTDPTTGELIGKPMTQAQKQTADALQQQRAQAKFEEFTKADARAKSLDQQIAAKREQIGPLAQAYGFIYDPKTGSFKNKKTGEPADAAALIFAPKLREISELEAQRTQAQLETEGHRSDLRTKFSKYYKVDQKSGAVAPIEEFGGVAPAGARRAPGQAEAPQTQGGGGRPTGVVPSSLKVGDTWDYTSFRQHSVGDIIEAGPLQYRVLQILPPDEEGKPMYKIRRIK